MKRPIAFLAFAACVSTISGSLTQANNPGADCRDCHQFKVGGTVYSDATGTQTLPGVSLKLVTSNGEVVVLDDSNQSGNFRSSSVENGNYLMELGEISSKTWHNIPLQSSCNTCHEIGGNSPPLGDKLFPEGHSRIPPGNRCSDCHHFPASMLYAHLKTEGVLVGNQSPLLHDASFVEINDVAYPVDPEDYADIQTVRPDIFVSGFFSGFDLILAVADDNGIPIEYEWDDLAQTHWITSVDGVLGNYWYHWVNDMGGVVTSEMEQTRSNRWDEFLWRKGTKLRLTEGEDVTALRAGLREEIARENANGGPIVGIVELSVHASNYHGNPPGSGRISATLTLNDVQVTAHDLRAAIPGSESYYSQPFQPGVVTSMDILFSLVDAGELDAAVPVFIDRIATSLVESNYIQAIGFPGVGLSHGSGSHGYAGGTHLLAAGAPYEGLGSEILNGAASTLHIPHDVLPIHAPDYSLWLWREFGPPYYEDEEPALGWAVPPVMRLERVGTTELRIQWYPSPCFVPEDYGIYEGTVGSWSSHERIDCTDDGGDYVELVPLVSGDRYYLVVPHVGSAEGSYGLNSHGGERQRGLPTCVPDQSLGCD